ncbi:MAG: DedA family protein [Candidatus Palauibacterales bacterium]|nr:DedA family protein [Candidatus Palauibacterales bacterium]
MNWIGQFGPYALFLAGFLEFLGIPFPGSILLLSGGALAGAGMFSLPLAWLAAVAGATLADQIWYHLARARGEKLLVTACRISMDPAACVCQANRFLDRFGPRALLIAKLVPGVSNLATPVAAVSGVPPRIFAVYSVTGAAIWAAVWLALGTLFSSSLLPVVEEVFTWAPRAVGVLAAVGLLLLAVKAAGGWWAVRTDRHDKRRQAKNPAEAPRQPNTGYLVELEHQASPTRRSMG